MKGGVGGEHHQAPSVATPPNLILADQYLQKRFETAFRMVQIVPRLS